MSNTAYVKTKTNYGLTAKSASEAMIAELETLFEDKTYTGPDGPQKLKIYGQMYPIQTEDDTAADDIRSLAPAIQVRLDTGIVRGANKQQEIEFALIECAYDNDVDRNGIVEVYDMIQEIMNRFMQDPMFGGVFEATYPMDWAVQQEETGAYYYGSVSIPCLLPAMKQESLNKEIEAMI